ncbi:hypothetical protein B484DRAFT_167358 [Ochromonadaceae sp. CCMP2298]|nr:hypothetical protein B484DRAFT_167358 [Ochromonadaceae sp. CCMP2298]
MTPLNPLPFLTFLLPPPPNKRLVNHTTLGYRTPFVEYKSQGKAQYVQGESHQEVDRNALYRRISSYDGDLQFPLPLSLPISLPLPPPPLSPSQPLPLSLPKPLLPLPPSPMLSPGPKHTHAAQGPSSQIPRSPRSPRGKTPTKAPLDTGRGELGVGNMGVGSVGGSVGLFSPQRGTPRKRAAGFRSDVVVSLAAQEVIRALLVPQPSGRLTAAGLLRSEWLSGGDGSESGGSWGSE